SFIDHRINGIFARDLAKSMLRSALPAADEAKAGDLINEIEFGQIGKVPGDRQPAKLPDTPTPGYQTFLGKQESFAVGLGQSKLELRNQKSEKEGDTLTITVRSPE